MATTSRPRKTVADLLALGDEVRAELIDGEIYVTPSPNADHQTIVARLISRMWPFVEDRALGVVLPAPLDVHLPSGDVVQPDLVFVRAEHREIVQDRVRGVPDLLVEVVSPSHPERDRIVKRDLFARNGVPEYWIVEPDTRSVEVLRLAPEGYAPAGWFGPGTLVETAALPGLRLAVDDVFRPAFRARR